jgi:CheY-like chemotaxis protein
MNALIRKRSTGTSEDSSKKPKLRQYHYRTLVAEDNEVNRILLRRILTRFGCEVDLTGDGEGAVECVLAGHYDLVLMDINMPKMSGE